MGVFWRILLFAGVAGLWGLAATLPADDCINFVIAVFAPLLVYPASAAARGLLDRKPAADNARRITTLLHAVILAAYGPATIKAVAVFTAWRGWTIPLPTEAVNAFFLAASTIMTVTVVNLALKALGAPFALALSRKLATGWLYRRTRNPMVLTTLIWFVSIGLALHSASFVAWALLVLAPAELYFLKKYEERELEIRFGDGYRAYRRRTPFLWPRLIVRD